MGRPPGTTVFVGNISYETTEEQLKEVFSQVGNVLSFRLMYDHDTGKAKGFGFCEYEDKETAMSARRNLNGTELNGRALRVDLTENDKQAVAAEAAAAAAAATSPASRLLPAALAAPNASLARLSPREIHETMISLKRAVEQSPNEMRQLLLGKPQLAHAILHAQIMLGVVPPPPIPQPPPQAAPPPHLAPMAPPLMRKPQAAATPPQAARAPPPMPPPMQAAPLPQPIQPPLRLDDEQAELFATVMSLTPEQIARLTPSEREGVMIVRNQFAAAAEMRGQPAQHAQRQYR